MNNDSFLIEEFDLDTARDICKFISNPAIRNKAVANAAAAGFAKKYFQDCDVDIESGLHNICQVLEDIDISDIYIRDNYIDVRLYFRDNELFVPKEHFDHNRIPAVYMFIKVSEDLSGGFVTGFITPELINKDDIAGNYYRVREEDLISFYDAETNFINKYVEDLPEDFETQIFDYLDNKLTDKDSFYKMLLDSKEARLKLQDAGRTKNIFNLISVPAPQLDEQELVQDTGMLDETLDIVDPLKATEEDLSLEVADLPEISDIEETENLVMEEPDTLTFDNNDAMDLDISIGDFEPIQENENAFPEQIEEIKDEIDISAEPDTLDNVFDDLNEISESDTYNEQPDSDFTNIEISEQEDIDFNDINIQSEINQDTEINTNGTADAPDIIDELETSAEQVISIQYPTTVTPSIESIEESETLNELLIEDLPDENVAGETIPEEQNSVEETAEENIENTEQIDTLFNPEPDSQETINLPVKPKPKNFILPILGAVVALGVVGYYSYTKFAVHSPAESQLPDNSLNVVKPVEQPEATLPAEEAMPVETVENVKVELNTNEGNAVSVPAIEQNLDASITVSNLHVEFEIPSGYKTSKTAERYFTKMGKIIQLNLKTELLLLTKQPITNKIAVELQYNKDSQKFEVKELLASSGEQTIDDLILKTVKNALNINLNMNMSIFGSVAGNPVLVIKL